MYIKVRQMCVLALHVCTTFNCIVYVCGSLISIIAIQHCCNNHEDRNLVCHYNHANHNYGNQALSILVCVTIVNYIVLYIAVHFITLHDTIHIIIFILFRIVTFCVVDLHTWMAM